MEIAFISDDCMANKVFQAAINNGLRESALSATRGNNPGFFYLVTLSGRCGKSDLIHLAKEILIIADECGYELPVKDRGEHNGTKE